MFAFPGLVQYGTGTATVPEGHLFGFSDNDPPRGMDRNLYLFRVKSGEAENPDAYEYFSGTEREPRWSRDVADRTAVFHDPSGIAWGTTCVYHRATGRYLLAVTVHEMPGDWGLYEGNIPGALADRCLRR